VPADSGKSESDEHHTGAMTPTSGPVATVRICEDTEFFRKAKYSDDPVAAVTSF
jgi:hypothetical protein